MQNRVQTIRAGTEFVFENNHLTNVTIYSNSGTNFLMIRGNTFDFTLTPTLKNVIQVGAANTVKWNAVGSSAKPKITISNNTISARAAAGLRVGALYIDTFAQAGEIEVFDNRFHASGGTAVVLATGRGVVRKIVIRNNFIRNDESTVPFHADAPIANDALTWRDNVTFKDRDTMSAITGATVTPLTVDAKAITTNQSRIWNGVAAATKMGWTFDPSAGGTWRPFGGMP